jgi:pimeloyl-ACP methyl ester carboxylesterase
VRAHPLAEEISGAELRIIEEAGHLFWISHPEETVAAVVEFLGEGG